MDKTISKMSTSELVRWNIKKTIKDPTAISLLATNVFVLAYYFIAHLTITTLSYIFFSQALLIIFFYPVSILLIKNFPKEGFVVGDKTWRKHDMFFQTLVGCLLISIFFAPFALFAPIIPSVVARYLNFSALLEPDYTAVLITITTLFANYLFSTIHSRSEDYNKSIFSSGWSLISALIPFFYGLVFCWMIFLPFGAILMIASKAFLELLMHNHKNMDEGEDRAKIVVSEHL